MAGADPFAIQKAIGHKDIKRTMIYVDIAKPHIEEQVEKLNRIPIPKTAFTSSLVSSQRLT